MHPSYKWLCNVKNEQDYREYVRQHFFAYKGFMRGDPQEAFNVPGAYSQGLLNRFGYIGVYGERLAK